MKFKHLLCCGAAIALPTLPANALTINLVDLGGVAGSEAETAFRVAADYWESILTNDVTISIGVNYSYLGRNTVALTSNTGMEFAVTDWVDGVEATRSGSTIDQTAVLPTLIDGELTMITNGGSAESDNDATVQVYRTGGTEITRTLWSTTALVKAVGDTPTYEADNPDQLDGSIEFNNNASFDFDPTDGIDESSIDFLGTAIHEMGHALGFTSGVEDVDHFSYPYGNDYPEDLQQYGMYSALDMFRYSDDPNDLAPGDGAVLDGSVGTDSYFSIDGGQTALYDGYFSTGTNHGDGNQASHWKDDPDACEDELGTMNPTACGGQMQEVTALDLAAFDAIGWNLNVDALDASGYRVSSADIYRQFTTAVPEPATWAMMLLGFAMLGGALRTQAARPRIRIAFNS